MHKTDKTFVYLVEEVDWIDRTSFVAGIFSTREKAEEHCDRVYGDEWRDATGEDEITISEAEVDKEENDEQNRLFD